MNEAELKAAKTSSLFIPTTFGETVIYLIEADRIAKEGPTLKNVADNLRTLAVIVAMALVVGFMFNHKSGNIGIQITAAIWSVWIGWYGLLAVAQTSVLVMYAFMFSPIGNWLIWRSERVKSAVIWVLALLVMCFAFSTLFLLLASFELWTKR